MARGQLKPVTNTVMDTVLTDDPELETEAEDAGESEAPYVLIGDASIPVSKKAGKKWKQRIDDALAATEIERSEWNASYEEYRKTSTSEVDPTRTNKLVQQNDTDENLTRENVKILLRTTYTRNPKIELSAFDNERKPFAKCLELALSALMNRKSFPGLNAKARIRRAVVHAHLTNLGVLKLSYQDRVGSKQEALQELYRIRKDLAKAKDSEEIDKLYAQLEQNEDNLPLRTDLGMGLSVTLPHRLIIDPKCTNADLSDADWVAEEMPIPTAYIKDRYLEKPDDADGKYTRKSDHKEVSGLSNVSEQENSADSIRDKVVNQVTGFTSDDRLNILSKNMTKCYIIWDKLTREISLYLAEDMTYPLWVWEDTMKLSRFYQHHLIQYTEPLDGVVQAGESTQYAGHAREINKINERVAFIRMLAFGELIYNSRVLKSESVEKLLQHMRNPTKFDAIGVDWDPETKLSDVFQVFVPPDSQIQELYNKADLMKVVDRVNAVSVATRGEQYKTNTTNKAIEAYSSQAATVANELADVVEDAVEELAWSMCEILVSKYTPEQIAALIGSTNAKDFVQLTVEEFNAQFGLTVAAGSTEKPTSENKKKEAIQITQGLGQFAQAAPITTMRIVTRMFSEAFSEFLVTDEDWKMLEQETQQRLTAPQAVPGQPPAGSQGGQQPTSVVGEQAEPPNA